MNEKNEKNEKTLAETLSEGVAHEVSKEVEKGKKVKDGRENMPQKKKKVIKSKMPPKKHYIKITYEDTTRTLAYAIIEITHYNSTISYKLNMDDCINSIYDDGGFWLNETTIIPYCRIYSVNAHIVEEKPKEVEEKPKEDAYSDKRGRQRQRQRRGEQQRKDIKTKDNGEKKTEDVITLT